MSGREGRRLVEEEELGEPARLEQRPALPPSELEPARDPAPAVVPPADPPGRVVEAAAVPVDEAAGRVRDQLAERRDAVLQRHVPLCEPCRQTEALEDRGDHEGGDHLDPGC
jgi:hypothetical protein